MKVCIKAMDQLYGGLHEMYDVAVMEVADMEEAEEIGNEMSRDVINNYSCIIEQLEEDAQESEPATEEEFCDALEDLIREDISYTIWELKDGAPIEELEDYEEFVEKWKK